MSTKRQKRVTKQVRITAAWHKRLKVEAAERGTTIVKILDGLLEGYYDPNGDMAIHRKPQKQSKPHINSL